MLRIGFLPSDFNPMVLMLGEAEDLRLLAGVLRRFAREQADVRLDRARLLHRAAHGDHPDRIARRAGHPARRATTASSGASTRNGRARSPIRSTSSRCPRAPPDRKSWNAPTEEEIPVKVSRGEYTDDFLRA